MPSTVRACAYRAGDRRLSSDEALGFPLWVEVFDFGNLHRSIRCCSFVPIIGYGIGNLLHAVVTLLSQRQSPSSHGCNMGNSERSDMAEGQGAEPLASSWRFKRMDPLGYLADHLPQMPECLEDVCVHRSMCLPAFSIFLGWVCQAIQNVTANCQLTAVFLEAPVILVPPLKSDSSALLLSSCYSQRSASAPE
jgi:hypothetical protein